MNEQDKLIEDQLETLPLNLQQAIKTVPWKALVQEIGKANILDTEQIVSLEQETMLVIYAFENPNDYISNITREVGVSEAVAYTIAESVSDKIFDPISKRSGELEKPTVPEIPPTNLPMVEKNEVAHDVVHIEPTTNPSTPLGASKQPTTNQEQPKSEQSKVSVPDYRYPGGADPYREPTQ